uniref:BTB domain-containing protein n=1 Tax=Meloidogyne enterolobii TaxID=390850 RepID=A0A6V7UWK9_MELEN|nr:unnamed protein product [Meloidogyne enterolobii]
MKTISLTVKLQICNFDKICEMTDWTHTDAKPLLLTSFRKGHPELPNVEWELVVHKPVQCSNIEIWLRQIGPTYDYVNTRYHIYAKKGDHRIDIARSKNELETPGKLGFTKIPLLSIVETSSSMCNRGPNVGLLDLSCDIETDCYNPTKDLKNKYSNMLENATFSDCVIKVGDKIIKAHRCVLAENSQVFRTMFEQTGMIESQKGEVTITDASPECVRAMLQFFYSGCPPSTADVDEVFVIAHKYEIEPLKYECEIIISSRISDKNFLQYCGIISLYGAPTVEKACINYIRNNRKSFLSSNVWKEVKKCLFTIDASIFGTRN